MLKGAFFTAVVVDHDELSQRQLVQVDGSLEQWEVIRTVVLAVVRHCRFLVDLLCDLRAERRPLLLDTVESLARYLSQEDAREELCAELLVLHYVKGLLQHVEARSHGEERLEPEHAEALNDRRVVGIVQHRVLELCVDLRVFPMRYF